MFKFILGAAAVVALVGYGVITTDDIETAGDTVVNGINSAATYVKERTDPSTQDQIRNTINQAMGN